MVVTRNKMAQWKPESVLKVIFGKEVKSITGGVRCTEWTTCMFKEKIKHVDLK